MAKVFSGKQIHKIGRIDQVIRDFFEANPSITEISAKELMPVFIQKGIFYKNHRDGLPIRNLLRDFAKEDKLTLLKHAKVVRHSVNSKWYFAKH